MPAASSPRMTAVRTTHAAPEQSGAGDRSTQRVTWRECSSPLLLDPIRLPFCHETTLQHCRLRSVTATVTRRGSRTEFLCPHQLPTRDVAITPEDVEVEGNPTSLNLYSVLSVTTQHKSDRDYRGG